MKSLLALLLATFLSGCSLTYVHRNQSEATGVRLAVGTDQSLGELKLKDGDGFELSLSGSRSTQSATAAKALDVVEAVANPVPLPFK